MPDATVDTWNVLRERLLALIPQDTYDTWFNRLGILDWNAGCLRLSCPNRYVKLWIESHYQRELLAAAKAIDPQTASIELVQVSQVIRKKEPRAESVGKVIEKLPGEAKPRPSTEACVRSSPYMLKNFVVGSSNRLAHAACCTVADSPAGVYNPVVIHGDHGLGKTHLLQGLAQDLQRKHPNFTIRVVSGEEFANAYVQALQSRRVEQFRGEFRRCHALLVDDVHFLAGKEKTQDEFLHTFDVLRHAGRQVVLTCHVHPREVKQLDVRLAERFQSGLVTRLASPELPTRIEIVRAKAQARGMNLPLAAAELLAGRVERSVRELEGAVCKLAALGAAESRAPDKDLVHLALRELGYLREGPLTLEEILEAVVQRTKLSGDEIRSVRRHAGLVRARHLAMYLCKLLTSQSLGEIGRFFGNRDHSTVLHATRKVANEAKKSEDLRAEIQVLRRMMGR